MTHVAEHDQLGGRPGASECPGVPDRRLEIEQPLHEYAGDIGEQVCLAEQRPILQEGVVSDVVRNEARERQREVRVFVAGIQLVGRRPRERGGFPRAPGERRTLSNVGVGILQ